VTVLDGLPVTSTDPWVTLSFAPSITVPGDAWVDWDVTSQVFITAADKYPGGLTAVRKSVVYYPSDLWKVLWHDGSRMSPADFIMPLIMKWEMGTVGSDLYDESMVGELDSFLTAFKGIRLVSTDPLVIEYYSDGWFIDAEDNVETLWPEYGRGNAGWHMIAVSNKAAAAGMLAYSSSLAGNLGVDQMDYLGGPSLAILSDMVDEAFLAKTIPFAPTLGAYITPGEAAARYSNLRAFYQAYGHFWVGIGPYVLTGLSQVGKTATLSYNPYHLDPADKWNGFYGP